MSLTWKQKAIALFSSFCLALSMVPAAAFADPGAGSASDDYPYFGTNSLNPLAGNGGTIDFTLNNNGEKVVAYCFNEHLGRPDGAPSSYWKLMYKDASGANLHDSLAEPASSKYSTQELEGIVKRLMYAGYPVDKAGMSDFIEQNCSRYVPAEQTDEALRLATQWAIWYITDGETMHYKSANSRVAWLDKVTGALVDYALDANNTSGNVELDMYYPKGYDDPLQAAQKQNMLAARVGTTNDPVTPPPSNPPTLKNTAAASVAFTPCATKTLTGGTLADGQFTFDLYENGRVIDTATNDADGNIQFDTISYTAAGTHTYTIKERNDAQAGVSYDTTEKSFTVKVTTHSAQTYDESATYYGRETYDYDEGLQYWIGTSKTDQGIQMFCTNADAIGPQDASAANQTYHAVINPTTIITSKAAAEGSMANSNRYDSDAQLQENLRKLFYYFETDDASQFQTDIKQRMVWYATGTDKGGDGNTYNVNGVSVKATKDANGIKNLLDAIYATVEAPAGYNLVFFLPTADLIANNQPQPLATGYGAVVSYEAGTPSFTNSIAAPQSTKVSLDGIKTLDGGALAQGQFSFKIEGSKNLSKTVTNEADGTIDFGEIEYTADDFGNTFTYFITEVNGGDADVTYDTTKYKVTVELSADGQATVKKFKVSGAGESIKDDQTYGSTLGTAGDGSFNHALSINGETAYCFNKDKEWPENGDTSEGYVKYENVSASDIQQYSTNANKDAILKAIYNGYPYDAAGLKAKYGLNDAQMQGITQVALWVATEYGSIDAIGNAAAQNNFVAGAIGNLQFGTNNSFWSQNPDATTKNNMYKCFADMTGWTYSYYANQADLTKTNYVGDTSALKDAPSGLALNLYIHPDNLANDGANAGGTQNLLSVGKLNNNPPAAADEPVNQIAFTNSIDAGPTFVEVAVSKVDLGGKGVVGAQLSITEGDDGRGTEVINWETEADGNGDAVERKVNNLEANKVYTLTETLVPGNYEQAESIVFKVDEDGNVLVKNDQGVFEQVGDQLTMVDGYAAHDISISKINFAGEEIAGAEITISGTELNGNDIGEISWTSVEGQNKIVQLKPGTYTFHEENAPEGYVAVTDIVFTIGIDGKIDVIANDGNKVDTDDGGLTVTDQYDNATVSVTGTKTWDDAFNQDGKRPTSVTIDLYNGTTLVDSRDVTAADNWQYSFTNLPKYTEGVLNDYKIQERNVPEGYTASVEGNNVTNTHAIETITVEGTKTWVDATDQSKRPTSIEVQLYADGNHLKSQTVRPGNDGTWKYSFTDLPKYATKVATQAGDPAQEIQYTVAEKMVDGYVTDVEGTNITNTRSEKTAVHVQKAWSDTNDADALRPGSVTVRLLANGVPTGETLELNAANNWHAHFTDLKGFDGDGAKIEYTVSEDAVDGYDTSIENDTNIDKADARGVSHAYRIVNTHEAEKVEISGTKTWDDGDDANGLRPNSIVVDLYADGEPYASARVTPDVNGDWKYTFNNLIKNHAGVEVNYTVVENDVPAGYVATVNDTDITNKHEVTHAIEISKVDLGGDEVAGAQVSIKNLDGSVVKAWTSGTTAQVVDLTKGEYIFHETLAKDGYAAVTDIHFTVDENGIVTVTSTDVQGGSAEGGDNALTVTDDYKAHKVKFSKTDLGGNELAGAQITVTGTVKGFDADDAAGKVSESWNSDGTAKTLELKPGTYKMVETAAPNGYEIATEIEFTVNVNGTITVNGTTTASEDKNVVTMVDDYTIHAVSVNKVDLGGKEIDGAEITVSGNDLAGNRFEESWTSGQDKDSEGNSTSHILNLKPGTYTFHEEVAPDGYTVVTDIEFEVDLDGNVTVTSTDVQGGSAQSGNKSLVVTDGYQDQTVVVSKTDVGGTEIEGAQLVIIKEGSDDEVARWTSGEDGKDADGKVKPHEVTLQPGTYVLTETLAPKGYKIAESITFTVDHLGNITVNGEAVDKVTMVDAYEDKQDDGKESDTSKTAKTGDDMTILGYTGIGGVAIIALGVALIARRRMN